MATAVFYYSKHHGNTKKLLDAIAKDSNDTVLIDVTKTVSCDLSKFDRIGIASGIYFNSFAKQVIEFAKKNLPENKPVFLICTCGIRFRFVFKDIRAVIKEKNCREIGVYQCLGFDTFGPFKIVGGIAKSHPNAKDVRKAIEFYNDLPYKNSAINK